MDIEKARIANDEYLVLHKKRNDMFETWRARQGEARTSAEFEHDVEMLEVHRALQAKLDEMYEAIGQRRLT